MQNTAVALNLISNLMAGDQFPVTDFMPPAPLVQLEQFDDVIPLPEETLTKIPYQKAKETYEKLRFEDPWSQPRKQKSSFFSMIMEMLNGKLIKMEEELYGSLQYNYKTTVDEADQATFHQLFSIGRWVVTRWGPLIRQKLVEGTFISLSDQGNYNQASGFAYTYMWRVNQRLLAHRLFILALHDHKAHGSLKNGGQQKVDSDQEIIKIWQLRWKESRRMAAFMPHIRDCREICHDVLNDLVEPSSYPKNAEQKYLYISKLVEAEDLMAELQASYFNKMLSTRQQSGFSRCIEGSLNYLISTISFLGGDVKLPREWDNLKETVIGYAEKSLKELISSYIKEYSAEEAFQKYIHAIEKDQLIYAKWLGQTMKVKSHFDWEREAVDFENYRRSVSRLLEIYHYVDDIIHNLMEIQSDVFEKVQSGTLKAGVFIKSQKKIQEVFLLLRKIDKLRIEMRLGYLKKIKTDINSAEIGVFERILTSFNNKLQRYFMEGNVIDRTYVYSKVMQESFEDTLAEFYDIVRTYESYLESMAKKIEVTKYRQELFRFQQRLSENKKYYPVFFDFESLKNFMDASIDSGQAMKVFIYNLQRQLEEKRNRENLILQEIMQKFISHIQTMSDYRERLGKVTKSLLEIKESSAVRDWQFAVKMKESCESTITQLYDSFVKYIISEKNRQSSLTAERVALSASNKFWRWMRHGEIFDKTPEYPVLIHSIDLMIQNFQKKIKKLDFYTQEKSSKIQFSPKTTMLINGIKKVEIIDNYLSSQFNSQ